jgi:alanine racemase
MLLPGQAILRVDLAAIVANWRDLCALHGKHVAGVVKADAYGLGADRVARALAEAGCRHFFVATQAEGIALRLAVGREPMIAVLNGCDRQNWRSRAGDLVPVLNSLDAAQGWYFRGHHDELDGRPVILHLDTGMSRLGLDAEDRAKLSKWRASGEPADRFGSAKLLYVMTHLACADEPDHPLNAIQAERFARLCDEFFPGVPRSLANSSGILLGDAFRSDLARPGCALYGINPTPGKPNPMRQVVTLEGAILQIRTIEAGDTVGYGASWTAPSRRRIATVAAGYADGYLRALSGRSFGHLHGVKVKLVGRVSMDLTTFDVTEVPQAKAGDRILLIGGEGNTPDDIAARCGTIGYEILTSLGPRYHRLYQGA